MPTNLFIKNGEILPIKYGYDRNYNDLKIYLEEFKNSWYNIQLEMLQKLCLKDI